MLNKDFFRLVSLIICLYVPSVSAFDCKAKNLEQSIVCSFNSIKLEEKPKLKTLLNKLIKVGEVEIIDGDEEASYKATTLQLVFEDTISKGLENGIIKKAALIIHTTQPTSPLRINGTHSVPDGIIPLDYKYPSRIFKNIVARHLRMLSILDKSGYIVSVFKARQLKTKIIGYANYSRIHHIYPNLVSRQIADIPDDYQGATYLIRDKKENIYAFSISSKQVSTASNSQNTLESLKIWFGKIANNQISKRLVTVDSFLKANDIDIYKYID